MICYSQTAIWAILVPIIVAFLSHSIAKIPRVGARLAKAACILASYFTLFCVLLLVFRAEYNPIQTNLLSISMPTDVFRISVYVDNLALIPGLFSSLFGAFALTYNVNYLSPQNKAYKIGWEFNRSYSFILLFIGAMLGTIFSGNLMGMLIFWELVSICSYVLISFWHKDTFCLRASLKCILMTHLGTLSLFVAAIVLHSVTGTLEMLELGQKIPLGHPVISIVFPLLLLAALPKTVQFPLHTWLPDGTVAPTSATVLFHICGFQTGLYAIVRFFFHTFYMHTTSFPFMPMPSFFGNISAWSFFISLIGAITLIIGALNGIVESDFKRVVAYSTISQLGYIVMAIGLNTPLGVTAGLFHMVSHVLYCGLLFLCAGAVIYATGKHDINELGGLSKLMPATAICSTIGALALATVPLLSDFASKYLIFHATLEVEAPFFTIIAFLGCVLNTAIALRLLHSVFMGKITSPNLDEFSTKDPPVLMLFPMIFASSALLVFGVFPTIPLNYLIVPGVQRLGCPFHLLQMPSLIITPTGFWNPAIVAISAFALSLLFVCVITYLTKKAAGYRKVMSEDMFKPFLCGEDVDLLDGVHAAHFYHALTQVFKINYVCNLLDADRFYNALSGSLSSLCGRMLLLDVRRYHTALAWFLLGAVFVLILALL